MTEEQKDWIDKASYEQLLRKWRFARAGDPIFFGKTGIYYTNVMAEKAKALSVEERSRISKQVGWITP